MALTFSFQGYTTYGVTYLVEGGGSGNLDAATVLGDIPPEAPIGRLFSQAVADDAEAEKILFGVDVNGDLTVPPNQLAEVLITGKEGLANWDVTAHANASALRVTVATNAEDGAVAELRIRFLHSLVR